MPRISVRKEPRQHRSKRLVADVLEAAVRVLETHGARHFTMARVAERAGVSVGSLYQYFPNKEAILFRLQSDEWQTTTDRLERILTDGSQPPADRLKDAVRFFIRSESEEAAFRGALAEAAPLYADTPEAREQFERSHRILAAFLPQLRPDVQGVDLAFAVDVVSTTLSAIGERLSLDRRPYAEIEAIGDAVGDMLCGWLTSQRPADGC